MKRLLLIGVFLLVAIAAAWTCELTYTITDSAGKSSPAVPGKPVYLEPDESYTLAIDFYEDHRNCPVPASATLFMLDGARWNPTRDTQALLLSAPIAWKETTARLNEASAKFSTGEPGTYTLEILRECPTKAGYSAQLVFVVVPSQG
ncbi:MAG: hypothetical protein CVV52_04780 [Spirochaetae bacterium HGW-Spirochaetae-8]|nr:MAG: hypothetical protein CVV52_04780 [Spirochaetae bacterium HGW-Spirochaetae-8]